ncbi:hypothetical protein WR25_04002 [Diploscapter pachys]|uniref:Ubiquitin-like-conjugating enzyme ATG10 n=1 Tax=Diploscapter pachys TaxID=2018661 RepID=A0A2A2JAL9_9BILA|nr:hypothetical protein WR25_04002 [Diploscapter pachys]
MHQSLSYEIPTTCHPDFQRNPETAALGEGPSNGQNGRENHRDVANQMVALTIEPFKASSTSLLSCSSSSTATGNFPTLTQPQFQKALTKFVDRNDQFAREKWTLHKSDIGIFAKQSVMVKWKNTTVNRQAHIVYNSTYQVPVLWFNFYRRDGIPLKYDDMTDLALPSTIDLSQYISLAEHPFLGVLFYNIHPCNTAKIMAELIGEENYILKWLSVYGAPIGVSLPPQIFTMPEVTNGVVPSCTTNGSAPNGAVVKENGEVSTRSISEASQSSQSEDGSC